MKNVESLLLGGKKAQGSNGGQREVRKMVLENGVKCDFAHIFVKQPRACKGPATSN